MHFFRVKLFGELGEADKIDEEHRNLPKFRLERCFRLNGTLKCIWRPRTGAQGSDRRQQLSPMPDRSYSDRTEIVGRKLC